MKLRETGIHPTAVIYWHRLHTSTKYRNGHFFVLGCWGLNLAFHICTLPEIFLMHFFYFIWFFIFFMVLELELKISWMLRQVCYQWTTPLTLIFLLMKEKLHASATQIDLQKSFITIVNIIKLNIKNGQTRCGGTHL